MNINLKSKNMDEKKLKEKVLQVFKKLIESDEKPKEVEKFKEVDTEYGKITYDSDTIENGTVLSIVNENGEKTVLKDGKYTIDGTKYTITDGKVVIGEVEPEKPKEELAEEKPEDLKGFIEALQAEMETHKKMIEDLTAQLNGQKTEMDEYKSKFSAYDSKFSELEEPQAKPAREMVKDKSNVEYETLAAQMMAS